MKWSRLICLLSVAQFAAMLPATAQKLPVIQQAAFKKDTFRIQSYGAKADGISLNTTAIQAAIDACNKKGGGVVLIPKGFWLTGPLVLKSNVNLHLAKNSLLQFTSDFNQYKLVKSEWEGVPQMRNQSPLSADNQQNIGITGYGIIDGNGDAWRMVKKEKLTASQWETLVASGGVVNEQGNSWFPTEKGFKASKMKNPGVIEPGKTDEFYESVKDFLRPNLLVFNKCKRILFQGVTFQNSPAWCLHPLLCEDLTLRGVIVKNPWYAQNGDGIDAESCKNVLIEDSYFDVGDDGLCIKSGRDEAGRKRGIPTENVIIRNTTVYHAHGGFVIGSEMSGGARNIFVEDCTFIGTDIGLRFKTTRGRGGVVENIYVNNINMKDIPGEAILFDMYYAAQDPVPMAGEKREAPKVQLLPVTEATPVFRNFRINNVICDGASKAVFVRGLPEMQISDIEISNLVVKAKQGIDIQEAKGITLKNVKLEIAQTAPLINIQNSSNIKFAGIAYEKADRLFTISGEGTKNIQLSGTSVTAAGEKAVFKDGAAANVLEIKK
ncbi:glycoside hydrolase family 28 protein [Filimonas effusa]|uniref:Glycoside hydrolase family 28 protein n=1 Tax=Filimonas effusa TaxID=2508721 RepID=A0A4V1MAW1_9BACT|nr:glycoside hydrolase family 28 protein [Filimonas effusa]RXK87256.1 glycoside hydrolase family 28 protein [Filimonas effusa]